MMMLPIRTLWSFQEGFNTIEATMSATGIPPFIMQLLSQNLIGEFVNILVAASDKYDARFVEPSTQNRAANNGDLVISTKLIFPNREKCSACMQYLDSLKNMA